MGLIRLIIAPIRRFIGFPLVQLLIVVAIILLLQAADDSSVFGRIFSGLDKLVDASVSLLSEIFTVKSFTRSGLISGLMIAYVYVACLLILTLLRLMAGIAVHLVARSNAFGLRNAIAQERGIAAYRAWLPLERIRPPDIPQQKWEETFAWPADNKPPYPNLAYRLFRGVLAYIVAFFAVLTLLQLFTPFPTLTWFGSLISHVIQAVQTH